MISLSPISDARETMTCWELPTQSVPDSTGVTVITVGKPTFATESATNEYSVAVVVVLFFSPISMTMVPDHVIS